MIRTRHLNGSDSLCVILRYPSVWLQYKDQFIRFQGGCPFIDGFSHHDLAQVYLEYPDMP